MNFFVRYPTLETGAITSAAIAIAIAFLSWFFFGGFPSVAVGIILGALAGTYVWNKGLECANVPPTYRAVPTWRGTRQVGAQLELGEGDYWFLKPFVGMQVFDMKERTAKILGIPIETQGETKVPTDLEIQWRPRVGFLYYYGNVTDVVSAFTPEAKSAARAFGISRTDIDHLVDSDLPESLKVIERDHLNRRAVGEVNRIEVNADGTAAFERIGSAPPWGMEILSVTVPDFQLPTQVTEASAEAEAARKRKETARTEKDSVLDTMSGLITKGVDPTAALGTAEAMVLPPEKRSGVRTENHVFGGLQGFAKTIVDGVLVGFGKQPLPEPTPAIPVAPAAPPPATP